MNSLSGLFIFISWVRYLFRRSKYLYESPIIYHVNLCFVSLTDLSAIYGDPTKYASRTVEEGGNILELKAGNLEYKEIIRRK